MLVFQVAQGGLNSNARQCVPVALMCWNLRMREGERESLRPPQTLRNVIAKKQTFGYAERRRAAGARVPFFRNLSRDQASTN